MEENNKMNSEAVKTKGNDCRLSDEELRAAAGGISPKLGKQLADETKDQQQRA